MRRRPLYSACNEDTRSELSALQLVAGDSVVAIASGGGRALGLLSSDASRVVAVDRRLDQVFNTELKAAAIDALSYETFREFVGVDPSAGRRELYHDVRPSLGLRCRTYWDARLDLIAEGVLYAGRLERALFGFCSALRRMGLFRWFEHLFACESLEEQQWVLRAHGTGVRAASVYWAIFCNPVVTWIATQDPSFLRSSEGVLGAYLFRRVIDYARTHLVRDSYFLHLIHYGKYAASGPLPVYLDEAGFERIRSNLDRFEIRNCRVEDALSQVGRRGVTKWSLSDISAWMTRAGFHRFVYALAGQLHETDRVCYRNFGVDHGLPPGLDGRILRLDSLCEKVEAADTSVFFRIEVLEAQTTPGEAAAFGSGDCRGRT